MNLVNRLIVVLALVVLVLFALMVIVLAWAYDGETIHKLATFAQYLSDHDNDRTKALITLVAAFTALVGLAFLLLELAPRAGKTVIVRDVGLGTAVLSTTAIARRVEQIVAELPQVEAAKAKVSGKKKAVEVNLQVMVDPESDLSALASEISRTTQETVTEQMNVALARPPSLRLYYSPRPSAVRAPARPSAAASPVAEAYERAHVHKPRGVRTAEEGRPGATVESQPESQGEAPVDKKDDTPEGPP
jgi:hypothetical protein